MHRVLGADDSVDSAAQDHQTSPSPAMPGHIKLVKGAVDPDPSEFLLPSIDAKKEDQNKPYDPKKSVWISDPKTHGYREGLLEQGDIMLEDPAAKVVVAVGHEKFNMVAKDVGRVNPPKFEKVSLR